MKEIIILKNDIIRIYSLEEINKKYVTEAELILANIVNKNSHIFPTLVWDNSKQYRKSKKEKRVF